MTDQLPEAAPEGDPAGGPAPLEPAPGPAGGSEDPDVPPGEVSAADTEGEGEPGQRDQEEPDDDPALGPQALADDIAHRRQMLESGIISLGAGWFGGPASVGGSAAGRDVHSAGRDLHVHHHATAGPTILKTGPIDPARLRHAARVHVAGDTYDLAVQRLRKDRLVVLRAADGSGKRTSALAMLGSLTGDAVHAVSADQVLGASGSGLTEQAGHLAESSLPVELAYTRLAALADDLSSQAAYLVITVPAETAAEADTEDQYVIDHKPPTSREEVLRSHLRGNARHATAAEQLLREDPGLERDALSCAVTPRAAAELAERLLRAVQSGSSAGKLQSVPADMRRDRARHLLRTDRPAPPRKRVELLYRRAALISVAVFAGLPHADAMAAAESLASAFITAEFPLFKTNRDLFAHWKRHLLAEPDITLTEREVRTSWGLPLRAFQLRFDDPLLAAAVLDTVWDEYDAVRPLFLKWLRTLAVSPADEAIRVRAAQVAGRLATRDFGHVYHQLLYGWANSVNPRSREAAATALESAAAAMGPHVRLVLADWCDRGNQHLQRAAVLALGTAIGEQDPDEVLKRLRRLALRNTGRGPANMAQTVRRSVAELFTGSHPGAVVRALGRWARDSDPRLRSLARQCVPPLAYVTGDSGQPRLLQVIAADPAAGGDAAAAFAAALDDTGTRHETWAALGKLAVASAAAPGLTSAAGELLAGLKQRSATARTQLNFYLMLWIHQHHQATHATRPGGQEGRSQ